jgi:hypothetical protein
VPDDDGLVERCFVPQEAPLTCVAACVAMVRRWRGEQATEKAILKEWGKPPFALELHAASDGEFANLDPDEAAAFEWLCTRVRQGWVVVTIMPAPRHPAHAVVLISTDDTGAFEYLDPAEALDGQPLRFSDVAFVKVWTGQVLVAKR